jgi:predicted PurR-regulated permease PerM
MDTLIQILAKLPALILLFVIVLAVIGGLGYIIYLLVRQGNHTNAQMAELTGNHLHELPSMAETLRRMETQQMAAAAALLGQLADIRESLAHIKGRLNGRS